MHTITVVYVLYRWCWNGEQDLVCLATGVRVFMVYFILHVAMAPAGWTWTAMLRDGGKKYSCKNYPPNV